LAKFKAKAQAIKAIKAMGGQVPTAAPEEIDISDAEQDEAELEAKRRESRTYSMIRAVAAEHVAAQKPNGLAKQPTYNKSLMYAPFCAQSCSRRFHARALKAASF
jgi:hypothetical protein